MELRKILTPERVRVPLQGKDKTSVITELIDLLAADGGLTNREAALEAVLKREAERSTGIGYGLAIPHGKTNGSDKLALAVGMPAEPVDFQSVDGRPVTFVALLVSPPDQTGPHIRALAKVSGLMNNEEFRQKLGQIHASQELYDAIMECDAADH
ncbi:MAG: PTS sugar transporter subunit IIA [Phycisphaerales bacterium]|nr:PTS sugar transporter subunit IIA [Phycisphaerales bacterium]